jgi:hypothetical protein
MLIRVCSLKKKYILKLRHTQIYKKNTTIKIQNKKNHSAGSKFNTHKTTRHVLKNVTIGVGIGISALFELNLFLLAFAPFLTYVSDECSLIISATDITSSERATIR